jgi:catechol 2,3-dioxygenase
MTQLTQPSPPDTAGRVRELGHIVLYVADLDRSLAFYRDILGWPVITQPGEFRAAGFRAGNTHHDLLLIEVGPNAQPIPTGRRLGMYHFGVKVGDSDDDLRALLARIHARPGLVTVVGAVDGGFVHSLYVHDPDGNEVELYIDVPGCDWTDPGLLSHSPRKPLTL